MSPLFCDLFGHAPTPLATRRRGGRKVGHCWMCQSPIARGAESWDSMTGPGVVTWRPR